MARDYDAVLRMNRRVLATPDTRVVFIRRRDQLARVLSDLLGQQTNLWGPISPDGEPSMVDEVERYHREMKSRTLHALDMDVIQWYLDHVSDMEQSLRDSTDSERCLDLWYEDLLGADVPMETRCRRYERVLEFLGLPSERQDWNAARRFLDANAKLNDLTTFSRIPNFAEICDRFKVDFAGRLGAPLASEGL